MIRAARPEDAEAILAIYAPFCTSTHVSFEEEPPSLDEMRKRMNSPYPWLVSEAEEKVIGYAYASKHRDRAGYRWSVDVSVYLAEGHRGKGLGRALCTDLLQRLRELGYYKAYAGIGQPNPASVALHESMGFTLVGVYRGVGYKLGRWIDVAWYQLALRPEDDPREPHGRSKL